VEVEKIMEKISINARIKAIRKDKGMNQADFGKEIGLKQGGVSYIEQEGNTITEQNITLICQKFHVRREWLVDGEGDMFYKGEPALFREFAKQHNLNKAEQAAIKYFLRLSDNERTLILEHLRGMAAAMDEARAEEDQAAALHRQLDEGLAAEKKVAEASLSSSYGKKA
jgi:transcriptional regulator with XRE-family HTH domain